MYEKDIQDKVGSNDEEKLKDNADDYSIQMDDPYYDSYAEIFFKEQATTNYKRWRYLNNGQSK